MEFTIIYRKKKKEQFKTMFLTAPLNLYVHLNRQSNIFHPSRLDYPNFLLNVHKVRFTSKKAYD